MAVRASADGGSRTSSSRRTYGQNYRKAPVANAIAKAARTVKVSNARKAGTRRAVQAVQSTKPTSSVNNAAAAVRTAAAATAAKKAAAAAAVVKASNIAKAAQAAKIAAAATAVKKAAASTVKPVARPAARPTGTTAVRTAAAAAPVAVAAAPKPTTTVKPPPAPTQGSGTAAVDRTLSGKGAFGREQRKRLNRGPRTGVSMTPEMLQSIARQRIVNYH